MQTITNQSLRLRKKETNMPAPKKTNNSFSKTLNSPKPTAKPTPKPAAKPAAKPTAKKPSNKSFTAQNIGKAIVGAAAATAAVVPVGRAIKLAQAAKAAKATTKAGQLAQNAKITAQQKATTGRKTQISSLEKQIKEAEAQIKSNAQRAAELAKKPKAPGAPSDRELGLLDANKKLAADLKKLRQTYYDTKTTF